MYLIQIKFFLQKFIGWDIESDKKFKFWRYGHFKWWKVLFGNFEKSVLNCEKLSLRKIFRHFLHAIFVMFVLLMLSNHIVPHAISALWKTHLYKLIPNWTQNHMITYRNHTGFAVVLIYSLEISFFSVPFSLARKRFKLEHRNNKIEE